MTTQTKPIGKRISATLNSAGSAEKSSAKKKNQNDQFAEKKLESFYFSSEISVSVFLSLT